MSQAAQRPVESATGDRPVRVVVVDHQELFRRGVRLLLEQEHALEVAGEASDGPGAVELAAAIAPDVVLMDVMPRGEGIEACARITQAGSGIQVVLLTTSHRDRDLYQAVRAGASGYLLKDSSTEELSAAIRGVATGRSLLGPAGAPDSAGTRQRAENTAGVKQTPGAEDTSRAGRLTSKLTRRELEVLGLVADGKNNREIAKQLVISDNTVKNHIRNILRKLQLTSRIEAVLYAVRENLV